MALAGDVYWNLSHSMLLIFQCGFFRRRENEKMRDLLEESNFNWGFIASSTDPIPTVTS